MKLRTVKREGWIKIAKGEDEAQFLVRPLNPKEVDELIDKATDTKWERNQRFREIDWYKFKILKIDAQIMDWQGIEDENGNPIPCSKATKESVYLYNPEIVDEVLDKADQVAKAIIDEKEGLEKNLSSGLKGSQKRTL